MIIDATKPIRKLSPLRSLVSRATGALSFGLRLTLCGLCLLVTMGNTELTRPAGTTVDVALVLAVDVSNSVDWWEYELQRDGLSHAIKDEGVLQAIRAGSNGRIAIAVVQWSGKRTRRLAVNWTVLSDQASAQAFARVIKFMPREFSGDTTHISGALAYATELLAEMPFTAIRKVIDVSGDGPENVVDNPQAMRDKAVAAGITVNGLAIENVESALRDHYRDFVIGGPGAFVLPIKRYEDFAAAMKKKLIREIDPTKVSANSLKSIVLLR